jgi:hypothetical protein
MFLRNTGVQSEDYTVQQPSRSQSMELQDLRIFLSDFDFLT